MKVIFNYSRVHLLNHFQTIPHTLETMDMLTQVCFMPLRKKILIALFSNIFLLFTFAQSPADTINKIPGALWNRESCGLIPNLNPYIAASSREKAVEIMNELATNDPKWTSYLPCCPDRIDEALSHDWEISNDYLDCFHLNAANCIRQKRVAEDGAGQQCCYHISGELLTDGTGAGTPDYYGPSDNWIVDLDHLEYDVAPWTQLSLNEYHSVWKPNQGCSSPFRVIVDSSIDWIYTYLWLKEGDLVQFSDVQGEVIWSENGSSSGPEGADILAESLLGWLLVSTKLPYAPTGSLIGMIYTNIKLPKGETFWLESDFMTEPFYIGSGTSIRIITSGLLFLGVNDGFIEDNVGSFDVAISRIRGQ